MLNDTRFFSTAIFCLGWVVAYLILQLIAKATGNKSNRLFGINFSLKTVKRAIASIGQVSFPLNRKSTRKVSKSLKTCASETRKADRMLASFFYDHPDYTYLAGAKRELAKAQDQFSSCARALNLSDARALGDSLHAMDESIGKAYDLIEQVRHEEESKRFLL
ncbi:MAG: hypothetical protein WCR70_05685 [Sphaerochaetaceae bacterium]